MTTYTQLIVDDFQRPNEDPVNPAIWTTVPTAGALNIVSHILQEDAAGLAVAADGWAYISGVVIPNNQYVELTLAELTSNGLLYPYARLTPSNLLSGYAVECSATAGLGSPGGLLRLFSGTILLGTFAATLNVGDIVRLECLGNSISTKLNGTIVISATDSAWPTGKVATNLSPFVAVTDAGISRFAAGSIGSPPTVGTVGFGVLQGQTLSAAVANPSGQDLIQVVNEGNKVVWNLTKSGVSNINPISPTPGAVLGQFFGANFAQAFPNPYNLDVLQVVGAGGAVVFHIDFQGNANTP